VRVLHTDIKSNDAERLASSNQYSKASWLEPGFLTRARTRLSTPIALHSIGLPSEREELYSRQGNSSDGVVRYAVRCPPSCLLSAATAAPTE
jgi:hypothetical protein